VSTTLAPSDHRTALLVIAQAFPSGSAVPVPREWLLELLEASPAASASPADRMLTAAKVAEMLDTTERWVYNHADQLGVKRLSRRCIRFSEAAVHRYLERRR
jgi:hypothetical protein